MFFQFDAAGDVQAKISPLRVPKNATPASYCSQFTGAKDIMYDDSSDSFYCGKIWNLTKDKYARIPYKLLPNGKAEYWIGVGNIITGRQPYNIYELNKLFSEKPDIQ